MNLADLGGMAHRARVAGTAPASVVGGRTVIGFTSPLTIATEARNVNRAAQALLLEMQSKLALGSALRAQYQEWFDHVWSPFYAGIVSILSNAGGAEFIGTDERFVTLQARRAELADFQEKLVAASGSPSAVVVPADPRAVPQEPKPQGAAPSWWPKFMPQPPTLTVPWWVWVGGTVVAIGGGYLAYRSWKNQRAMQNAVIHSLPRVFPETAPVTAAYEAASTAHDCGCSSCGDK